MLEFNHRGGWVLKNWCFWIVVLENALESPLDCQEFKSILKEINPEYSLEGLMMKLTLYNFKWMFHFSSQKILEDTFSRQSWNFKLRMYIEHISSKWVHQDNSEGTVFHYRIPSLSWWPSGNQDFLKKWECFSLKTLLVNALATWWE